ncbi:MAG: matrixin family metalloprotease [Candidatus Aenigmatarchaeota archaeon]
MSLLTTIVVIFFVLLSVYFYYYLKQSRTVVPIINEFNSNFTATATSTAPPITYTTTPLLFPNIRWAMMPLSVYTVISNCSSVQVSDVSEALQIWEEKTSGLISFTTVNSDNADVVVDCSKNKTSTREGRQIISKVGEGGPSSIYDTGLFNLTTRGKIILFTSGTDCKMPIIALHEMGHVLGLDHSENPSSIMYEFEECDQAITPEIVSTLQSLYSYPSNPDLYFENATAIQSNFYLSVNFTVKNEGLIPSDSTTVSVLVNGNQVKSIDLSSIKPAQGYFYSLGNILVTNEVTDLKLVIDPMNQLDELDKSNNFLSLTPG